MTAVDREDFARRILHDFEAMDGEDIVLVVERENVEPDVSFSADAMDVLLLQLQLWVGSRVMRRWDATHEPPSILRVELRVSVQ